MKDRYNCTAIIHDDALCFKRYGENKDDVRKELEEFIKEAYDVVPNIVSIEKDKTHPYNKKEKNDT